MYVCTFGTHVPHVHDKYIYIYIYIVHDMLCTFLHVLCTQNNTITPHQNKRKTAVFSFDKMYN